MISLKREVAALLSQCCRNVFYFHPKTWVEVPVIAWYESANHELGRADGREFLAELRYTVDVWAVLPEELDETARRVDEVLTARRLRRDFCSDGYEQGTGFYRRELRYRCVADAQGNIYQ